MKNEPQADLIPDSEPKKTDNSEPIRHLLKEIIEYISNAQLEANKQNTKQTEIIAKSTNRFFSGVFIIATMILFLAAIALFQDKDQITEKIIIALLAFLGGLGAAKSINRQG